ncbi:MAG TPA: hypothetical protein VK919_05910 [Solirubrobacterales bacterium]|nr:hypothetical protein [Solirubrobacterales bacterium]
MGIESEGTGTGRRTGGGGAPGSAPHPEGGVAEALRAAVERTLTATAGPAASTRDRALTLLDDVARLGREARDELARRGQEAGAGLARRGQGGLEEAGRRLEAFERRIAALEARLAPRQETRAEVEDEAKRETNPKPEG